jgi:hypothetical protein
MGLRVGLDDLEKRQRHCPSQRFRPPFPERPAHNIVTAMTELFRLPVTLPYTLQVLFDCQNYSSQSHYQLDACYLQGGAA